MLESDVVPILLQKLGEEKVRESAFDIIRTFAKYGTLLEPSRCQNVHSAIDNSRSKILDPAFMTTLLSKFASKDVFVRESAIDSIKALAKYGMALLHQPNIKVLTVLQMTPVVKCWNLIVSRPSCQSSETRMPASGDPPSTLSESSQHMARFAPLTTQA